MTMPPSDDRTGASTAPQAPDAWGALDPVLADAARAVAERAYAPYSNFHVGCALRTAGGGVYAACNVENSAYPLSGCAERHALAAAVAAEGAGVEVVELVVLAFDAEGRAQEAAPCGGCRQQIFELGPRACVGFVAEGEVRMLPIEALLPFGFRLAP
ncbi:cytidine deaminase [Aquimonas voraii]|uniref:Cytidine deaminase n=2 Tax=Aquimonas voraii TaxID=265719 RepID=A0A1G6VDH4_9GAMM|nr:cytidine deaminase [Aquimonas voraii]